MPYLVAAVVRVLAAGSFISPVMHRRRICPVSDKAASHDAAAARLIAPWQPPLADLQRSKRSAVGDVTIGATEHVTRLRLR